MSQHEVSADRPLTDRIRSIALSGVITLPPLPRIADRLMNMLGDEDRLNAKELADLIHREPAIASALLRTANSAFFGGLMAVDDIGQAIARLGLRRVSSLVTTIVHRGQFESANPLKKIVLEGLWIHSVAVAIGARSLADLMGEEEEETYLAGLFHDIGKLITLKAVDHLAATRREFEMTAAVLDEALQIEHADLGHRVLSDWRVPPRICRAVLLHHADPAAIDDRMVLRVQAADAIAMKIGAHTLPDPDLVLEDVPAIEKLNVTEVELLALMVDLEDELRSLREAL